MVYIDREHRILPYKNPRSGKAFCVAAANGQPVFSAAKEIAVDADIDVVRNR